MTSIFKFCLTLSIVTFACVTTVQAQFLKRFEKRTKFKISINGGVAIPFTDLNKSLKTPVFEWLGSYSPLAPVQIILSVEKGELTAGENKMSTAYFKNSLWTENLIIRFCPLAFFKRNLPAPDFYFGGGVAMMQSNTYNNTVPGSVFGPSDGYKGNNIAIPLEIGVDIPILIVGNQYNNQSIGLNLNYRHYFTFSDEWDGYVPIVMNNQHYDAFGQITVGLSYSF